MPSFRLKDGVGNPLAGQPVAFLKYCDRVGGARTPPVIFDHGDGLYSFVCPVGDVSDGVGYLIDCGAGANPPRGAGYVGNGHVFFAGYDVSGAFNAGLAPAITLYVSTLAINLIPIPAVDNLGGGLYAFTPTNNDRINGARFAIDCGASAGANRYISGDLGDGLTPDPGSPTPPGSIDFSSGPNTAAPIKRALYFDPISQTFPRKNGGMVFLTGKESIAQAVRIRLSTFRGEWYLAINRGLPFFDQIFKKAPDLKAIEQLIRSEIESVPGVKNVTTYSQNYDKQKRKLSVTFKADSDFGEIEIIGLTVGGS